MVWKFSRQSGAFRSVMSLMKSRSLAASLFTLCVATPLQAELNQIQFETEQAVRATPEQSAFLQRYGAASETSPLMAS